MQTYGYTATKPQLLTRLKRAEDQVRGVAHCPTNDTIGPTDQTEKVNELITAVEQLLTK